MSKVKDNLSYTTLEVILIILLIAVWLGVALPRFGAGDLINRSRLKTTVYNIGSDIRYARSLAISNARTYIIDFDFTQKEYKIYRDSIAPENQIGQTKTIPTQITCSGTDQFDFTALGSATFAGSGILNLSSGTVQYQITVISPTGTVRIQKP